MEDLKESIAEVSEMEQIRIECEYRPSRDSKGLGLGRTAAMAMSQVVCAGVRLARVTPLFWFRLSRLDGPSQVHG